MKDTHVDAPQIDLRYLPTCRNCKRKFRGRADAKFGSDSCRQAACRERKRLLEVLREPIEDDGDVIVKTMAAKKLRHIGRGKGGAA